MFFCKLNVIKFVKANYIKTRNLHGKSRFLECFSGQLWFFIHLQNMFSHQFIHKATFIIFLSLSFSIVGQQDKDLLHKLENCKSDSIKCLILTKLRDSNFDYFTLNTYDSTYYSVSKKNFLNSKNSVQKKYFAFHYAESLRRFVNFKMKDGKTTKNDLIQLNYIIKIYKISGKMKFIASSYLEKGYYFYCNSDFKNALLNYQKGLRIAESVKADYEIALALNNIAALHNDAKNFNLCLKYYKQCLHIIKREKDQYAITTITGNIGLTYYKLKEYSLAAFYLNKAILLAHENEDINNEERSLNLLGDIYIELNNNSKAFEIYHQAFELSKRNDLTSGIINSQIGLSVFWLKKGDLINALSSSEEAYQLALTSKNQEQIRNSSKQLIEVYKATKNYKKVVELSEIYNSITDSINTIEANNKLLQSKYEYEYDKKAIADSILQVKVKQVYSIQIEKDRNLKVFFVIFISLVLIFAFLIFKRYRFSQKQKIIIEQNNRDLERQHLMNQKIFSVISHDFRGPMLSLQFLLESLQTKGTNQAINQLIQDVNSEVGNASEILENLLNWARTEIGMTNFEQNKCTVKEVLNEVEKEFSRKIALKSLKIKQVIDDHSIAIPADILRIVLRNLLSNAIKFSYEKSVVSIQFTNDVLTVKDEGIGISQSKKNKLFKQEIDTELGTNNEEGFGLGLYIVAELLNKYNYQISVESEENSGTLFTIREK